MELIVEPFQLFLKFGLNYLIIAWLGGIRAGVFLFNLFDRQRFLHEITLDTSVKKDNRFITCCLLRGLKTIFVTINLPFKLQLP